MLYSKERGMILYLILTMPILNFLRAIFINAVSATDLPEPLTFISLMGLQSKPSVSSSTSVSIDSTFAGGSAPRPPLSSMARTARLMTCTRQGTCCRDALNALL